MQIEIIDGKEFIKFPCKIGIDTVGAGESIIWIEKQELQKLLDPKLFCDHVYIACDENGNEAGGNQSFAKCYKCGFRP